MAAFLTRTRQVWPLLALYGAGAAVASLFVNEPPDERDWTLLAVLSVTYVSCGAIAWRREPLNPVGPLMIGFGSLRATALLVLPTLTPLGLTIGIIAQDFAIAVFVMLMLYFPTGRLGSPRDIWIAVPVLFALGPLELVWMAFLPSEGPGVPENLLAFWPNQETADHIDTVQRTLLASCQLALAVLIARRWWRASSARRRVLMPALVGSFALFFFTAIFIVDKIAEQIPRNVIWLYVGVFTTVPIAMLTQMVRARLAHTGIGDLLVSLRGDVAPERLRGALARSLHDPTLRVAYWLPEYGSYADADGQQVEVVPAPGRAVTPIDRDGQRIAVLEHDDALLSDPGLLDAVTAAAAFTLENARLQTELRARLEELRGSRARIIEATQDERRRLERNLHDGAQQRLVALSLELGILEARYGDDPEARAQIAGLRGELADSLAELRELARGLHPAVLSDHGLQVALEGLVARAPLPVRLHLQLKDRLPTAHEVAAYYLVSESLTNVAKYADATAVQVEIARTNGELVVEVVDDGCGGATTSTGSGLRGLADRVEALDGRLRVWSPQGGGTRVRAEIPCG
ncbi:MAG TPA: sensor histidine kinase [Solirubrobacteraceae bacterium]|nr:sensor histidine kinase [Solirubrobacteraceae bacterium]